MENVPIIVQEQLITKTRMFVVEVTVIMKQVNMVIIGIASFMKEFGDLIRRRERVRNINN